MRTYKNNETVKGGYYLNVHGWNMEAIDGTTGRLPGTDAARYVRVPLLAMLFLAPVLGLAFVIVLPFLGIGVLGEQLWRKAEALRHRRHTVVPAPATAPRR